MVKILARGFRTPSRWTFRQLHSSRQLSSRATTILHRRVILHIMAACYYRGERPSGAVLPLRLRHKHHQHQQSEQARQLQLQGATPPQQVPELVLRHPAGDAVANRVFTADEMVDRMRRTSMAMVEIHKQLLRGEELYHEETNSHGNLFKGWDMFIDSKDVGLSTGSSAPHPNSGSRRMPATDRWFSGSCQSIFKTARLAPLSTPKRINIPATATTTPATTTAPIIATPMAAPPSVPLSKPPPPTVPIVAAAPPPPPTIPAAAEEKIEKAVASEPPAKEPAVLEKKETAATEKKDPPPQELDVTVPTQETTAVRQEKDVPTSVPNEERKEDPTPMEMETPPKSNLKEEAKADEPVAAPPAPEEEKEPAKDVATASIVSQSDKVKAATPEPTKLPPADSTPVKVEATPEPKAQAPQPTPAPQPPPSQGSKRKERTKSQPPPSKRAKRKR